MKNHYEIRVAIVLFLMLLTALKADAQRKRISLNQADPRFEIHAESYFSSLGENEEYYFFVKNKTSDKYSLVVEVTINQNCHSPRNFNLGYNQVFTLQPNGQFTPDNDHVHIFLYGKNLKDCVKKSGDSYTGLQSISYRYASIVNLTQEENQKKKEEEERKAKAEKEKKERELAQLKAKEEREAAEKKAKEEREVNERKAQEQRESNEALAARKSEAQQGQNTSNESVGAKSGKPEKTSFENSRSNSSNSQTATGPIYNNPNVERDRAEKLAQLKREEQLQLVNRQIAENKRKAEALDAAMAETTEQWNQGNFLEGSKALGTEYARQGNATAAYTTVAIGTGLQIFSMVKEERERKRAEEERRMEIARRAEEERVRREAELEAERKIVEQQKKEFESLAFRKKNLVNAEVVQRNVILNPVTIKSTHDVFATNNEPLYFFAIYTKEDPIGYKEKIVFPETIDITIKKEPKLFFSEIIKVDPQMNGEYPLLKEIIADIKQNVIINSTNPYKIFNWSKDIDLLQMEREKVLSKAQLAGFNPIPPPTQNIVNLHKANTINSRDEFADWEINPSKPVKKSDTYKVEDEFASWDVNPSKEIKKSGASKEEDKNF